MSGYLITHKPNGECTIELSCDCGLSKTFVVNRTLVKHGVFRAPLPGGWESVLPEEWESVQEQVMCPDCLKKMEKEKAEPVRRLITKPSIECTTCLSTRVLNVRISDGVHLFGGGAHGEYSMVYADGTERTMRGHPGDVGIHSGVRDELLAFSYCLDCGCIQGEFPLPETLLETQPLEDPYPPDRSDYSLWACTQRGPHNARKREDVAEQVSTLRRSLRGK